MKYVYRHEDGEGLVAIPVYSSQEDFEANMENEPVIDPREMTRLEKSHAAHLRKEIAEMRTILESPGCPNRDYARGTLHGFEACLDWFTEHFTIDPPR